AEGATPEEARPQASVGDDDSSGWLTAECTKTHANPMSGLPAWGLSGMFRGARHFYVDVF
ncbi:MAG: hypothetical protein LBB76_07670, partial [Azoarcus sp.]|nr:hypothetical protein [Azoarcus sp.]